jgi:hypothetical protein
MIISLVAVLGLQGMENPLAVTNDESKLKEAFLYCVKNDSSIKRRLAVFCPKEAKTPDEIHCLTKKVIGNNVVTYFLDNENANAFVYSCFNAERKTMCTIYDTDGKLAQCLEGIKESIEKNELPLLCITSNLADANLVCKALRKDVKLFSHEFEEFKTKETLKALIANSELKKQQPGLINNLRAFFTNRWVLAGGFSLAALFAYYYNYVR